MEVAGQMISLTSVQSMWWQEIASTVCRKRTTVSLISAIGTVIFTITPTCQRHTRTIQTSKVRRWTRCNQSSYTKMSQTYIYTYTRTHTHIHKAYIYSRHLIIHVNLYTELKLHFKSGCNVHVLLWVTLFKNKYVYIKQNNITLVRNYICMETTGDPKFKCQPLALQLQHIC